jgi:hypothetical protein
VKLPIPAFLRALVPEHWARVPEALRLVMKKSVLIACSNGAGGSLWPQGKTIAIVICKGVHLLFNNISLLADCPFKELGTFENRCSYLSVVIQPSNVSQSRFNSLPSRYLIRKQIIHAPNGLDRITRSH